MKYFAKIENDTVLNTILCEDDWQATDFPDYKQFIYIEYTEQNPAAIGEKYLNGYFYSYQPYPSWTRGQKGDWIPPKPMPEDENNGLYFVWNEESQDWEVNL